MAQPLDQLHRMLQRGLRQQQRELLAAEPSQQVLLAHDLRAQLHQPAQRRVAARVAQRVVDALEVVDVHHHQRHLQPVAPAARHLRLRVVQEAAPVGRAGQRIGRRQPLQLKLQPLAVGEVDQRAEHRGLAVVHDRHHRQQHPQLAAVGRQQADLLALQTAFLLELELHALAIARVAVEADRRLADELIQRASGDQGRRAIRIDDQRIALARHHHRDWRVVQHGAQALLAVGELPGALRHAALQAGVELLQLRHQSRVVHRVHHVGAEQLQEAHPRLGEHAGRGRVLQVERTHRLPLLEQRQRQHRARRRRMALEVVLHRRQAPRVDDQLASPVAKHPSHERQRQLRAGAFQRQLFQQVQPGLLAQGRLGLQHPSRRARRAAGQHDRRALRAGVLGDDLQQPTQQTRQVRLAADGLHRLGQRAEVGGIGADLRALGGGTGRPARRIGQGRERQRLAGERDHAPVLPRQLQALTRPVGLRWIALAPPVDLRAQHGRDIERRALRPLRRCQRPVQGRGDLLVRFARQHRLLRPQQRDAIGQVSRSRVLPALQAPQRVVLERLVARPAGQRDALRRPGRDEQQQRLRMHAAAGREQAARFERQPQRGLRPVRHEVQHRLPAVQEHQPGLVLTLAIGARERLQAVEAVLGQPRLLQRPHQREQRVLVVRRDRLAHRAQAPAVRHQLLLQRRQRHAGQEGMRVVHVQAQARMAQVAEFQPVAMRLHQAVHAHAQALHPVAEEGMEGKARMRVDLHPAVPAHQLGRHAAQVMREAVVAEELRAHQPEHRIRRQRLRHMAVVHHQADLEQRQQGQQRGPHDVGGGGHLGGDRDQQQPLLVAHRCARGQRVQPDRGDLALQPGQQFHDLRHRVWPGGTRQLRAQQQE